MHAFYAVGICNETFGFMLFFGTTSFNDFSKFYKKVSLKIDEQNDSLAIESLSPRNHFRL